MNTSSKKLYYGILLTSLLTVATQAVAFNVNAQVTVENEDSAYFNTYYQLSSGGANCDSSWHLGSQGASNVRYNATGGINNFMLSSCYPISVKVDHAGVLYECNAPQGDVYNASNSTSVSITGNYYKDSQGSWRANIQCQFSTNGNETTVNGEFVD